jgi:pimeloyl-ACP methyl ester carboxylesterase
MQLPLAGGGSVYVKTHGEGPPVLLLHGNPDTADVWDAVARRLAPQHRCLAPDLPEFGRSLAPASFEASLDGQSAWVDGVVSALDLREPFDLVVHDFGGLFGLAWAIAHPARVRRLAILNTMFFPDYRWHFWARVWRTPLLGEISFLLNTRRGFTRELRRGSSGLPVGYAHEAYARLTPAMHRMVLRLYRAADPATFAPRQEGLRALVAAVPTIVVWGDRDPYLDSRLAERFGAREVHHLPECGHWLQVEDPEAVATRLLTFFG